MEQVRLEGAVCADHLQRAARERLPERHVDLRGAALGLGRDADLLAALRGGARGREAEGAIASHGRPARRHPRRARAEAVVLVGGDGGA